MDQTQLNNMDIPHNLDGPSEPIYRDARVRDLFSNGLISRAEADVFDIIADFNDGQGGTTLCQMS